MVLIPLSEFSLCTWNVVYSYITYFQPKQVEGNSERERRIKLLENWNRKSKTKERRKKQMITCQIRLWLPGNKAKSEVPLSFSGKTKFPKALDLKLISVWNQIRRSSVFHSSFHSRYKDFFFYLSISCISPIQEYIAQKHTRWRDWFCKASSRL